MQGIFILFKDKDSSVPYCKNKSISVKYEGFKAIDIDFSKQVDIDFSKPSDFDYSTSPSYDS